MLLTICLILIILLLAAALGGGYALFKNPPAPPVIRAEIILPAPNVSRQIVDPKIDEPMPQDILDYIDMESEDHARTGRRMRARALRAELGSWPAAFSQLQREDAS